MTTTWTEPYHGVTHTSIGRRQCTVCDVQGCITATVFGRRGSGRVMADAIAWPRTFATVAAAQAWCEETASRFTRDEGD